MSASRTCNGYRSSAAGNAQARFAFRAFEIAMAPVRRTGEKGRNRVEFLLYAIPKPQKHRIFGTALIHITRKSTQAPNSKQHKLKQRKYKISDAVGKECANTEYQG